MYLVQINEICWLMEGFGIMYFTCYIIDYFYIFYLYYVLSLIDLKKKRIVVILIILTLHILTAFFLLEHLLLNILGCFPISHVTSFHSKTDNIKK